MELGWSPVPTPSMAVPHLESQQEADSLKALLAPVHIVPQEQVIGLWRITTILKQPEKVRILAVDVACRATTTGIRLALLPTEHLIFGTWVLKSSE